MSPDLDQHRDVVDHLRRLALAAGTATQVRPDLAEAVLHSHRAQRRHRRRWALTVGGGLAVAGAVAAAALPGRGDYFRHYQPSGSMEPTLEVGEQLVAGKHLQPQRGDLVVVHFTYQGADLDVVQRVLGLPGDRLACPTTGPSDACETLTVNGRAVPEPYTHGAPGRAFPQTAVPPDQLFLLGDNRDAAVDSRITGPIAQREIRGVGVRITSRSGAERTIPGAPLRPAPDGSQATDPANPPPGSATAPD